MTADRFTKEDIMSLEIRYANLKTVTHPKYLGVELYEDLEGAMKLRDRIKEKISAGYTRLHGTHQTLDLRIEAQLNGLSLLTKLKELECPQVVEELERINKSRTMELDQLFYQAFLYSKFSKKRIEEIMAMTPETKKIRTYVRGDEESFIDDEKK